ncbi:hypothetical protein F5B21DRAFT_528721 [Xylaria acuta]|nr:hypothetical protein F5B21DRAFT_528721 [Xylaria acuta]
MALLYGEGDQAFVRLQEEIINQTHDHSILAWGKLLSDDESLVDDTQNLDCWKGVGALAASPADFKDCWDFERASEFLHYNDNLDFQITTAGIRLGANISHALLRRPSAKKIICLKRDSSVPNPCILVQTAGLPDLPANDDGRLAFLQIKPTESQSGLSDAEYRSLAHEVTHVVRDAYPVNFLVVLDSFMPQFDYLSNIMRFAANDRTNLRSCLCRVSQLR